MSEHDMYVNMDETYKRLVWYVLNYGNDRPDRTGTGTKSLFGAQYRVNLQREFPLITTKKVHFKSVAEELFWMLRGESNVKGLQEKGVTIWNEWADKQGNLGPVYGAQWRYWWVPPLVVGGLYDHVDQIDLVIKGIKKDPHSRRHIISAWNVAELPYMALAPCHVMYQFYVEDHKLSCMMTQRSADLMLGLPFNIASTALLTHIIAYETGYGVGEVVHSIGDLHIYKNHIDLITDQCTRKPFAAPQLHILDREGRTTFDYGMEDVKLVGYEHHPAISAKVAV